MSFAGSVKANGNMPKSVSERVKALRDRRALLDEPVKRHEYALTDKEKIEVDKLIKGMRK